MAIYYVRTDGDNTNSGTGYTTSNAWQTLAKAISTVAAGDTVYIAPGTYYETMTIATAGGASTIIKWIGDKESQYFLDKKPGYVRITGCNSVTGVGGATTIINNNSKDYNHFYNLVIDGIRIGTGTGIIGSTASTTKIYNTIIYGMSLGASNSSLYKCVVFGHTGANGCNTYNSVVYALYQGLTLGSHYNSIVIGCNNNGYDGCSLTVNCIAMFCSNLGFSMATNMTYKIINCIALYCSVGIYGTNLIKSKSIFCNTAFMSSSDNKTNRLDCKYVACGSSGADLNPPSKFEGYTDISKLLKLATAIKFDLMDDYNWSSDSHQYTIAGHTNIAVLPVVAGATLTNLDANRYYLQEGVYNGQAFYVNDLRNYSLFYSSTLRPNNWVLTSGITVNELATVYCYNATQAATYTRIGWSGTTTVTTTTPYASGYANQDYVSIGTYNSQPLYQGIFKTYILFYSSTLQPNNWVLTTGVIPNEAAVNYAYSANLTGTYTNSGYTGTIINSTYTPITFAEDYDILQQPRRMGDGNMDCGPFEYSHVDLEWTTYKTNAPAIKISQSGQKRLTITAKGGTPKTISTWVNFNLSGGTDKPQLIISSSEDVLTTNPITITATGLEDTWELLTTTFTPKADGLIFVNYYCRTTGTDSYAIFSDFKI